MKTALFAATLAALTACSGTAYAQSADATSQSESQSSIYNQGDSIRSSTAIAPSSNTTAPCVIGRSGGIGVLGAGVSMGGGRIDRDCVTRQEAQILTQIAKMRGTQRRAAIMHFCVNTESMRRTMVALGWCKVVAK